MSRLKPIKFYKVAQKQKLLNLWVGFACFSFKHIGGVLMSAKDIKANNLSTGYLFF